MRRIAVLLTLLVVGVLGSGCTSTTTKSCTKVFRNSAPSCTSTTSHGIGTALIVVVALLLVAAAVGAGYWLSGRTRTRTR
jgi:uncharacterized protein HemX